MKFLVDFVNGIVGSTFSLIKFFLKLCGYGLICLIIMSMADTYFAENTQIYVIIIIFVFIFIFQKELLSFSNAIRKTSKQMKRIQRNNSKTTNNNPKSDTKVIIKSVDEIKNIDPPKEELIVNYSLPSLDLISELSGDFKRAVTNIEKSQQLKVFLGKAGNKVIYEKVSKFPNMLVGGTITTGKTSFVNSIICSLLMTQTPQELKLVICDSKKVDYAIYNDIPHLLKPVITDLSKLKTALNNLSNEIDKRYSLLNNTNQKNIEQYNSIESDNKLAYILLVVDELTSFITVDEEINSDIEKISQLGWNVGIHSIIVVNHPSAKIISTIAKGNFPTRVAFKTTSMQDSRMILDDIGAEKLNGVGNALYSTINESMFKNIKTLLIDDDDIKNIVSYIKTEQVADYNSDFGVKDSIIENEEYDDPLYNEILDYAIQTGKISASLIQRKFRLGYNRAARVIDLLEERGIVGPQNGSIPREVLVKLDDK